MAIRPKVWVVLVNYNGINDTLECVRSLKDISYPTYEIVIVDNASKDREALQGHSYINKNAKLIYSDINGGFSAGNNIGIKYALEHGADYILLLNNDTTVTSDFLEKLVESAEKDDKAGIVTGNIYYFSIQDRLWYADGSYNRKSGFTEMCGEYCDIAEAREVSFACGCLMLLKRAMIEEIGQLDDSFFLYSEDTEYCCRALDHGWKIIWNPAVRIYHKVSASTGNNSALQQYYIIRNNLKLISSYGESKLVAYIYRLLFSIKEVMRGRCYIRSIVCAYQDFIRKKYGKSDRF